MSVLRINFAKIFEELHKLIELNKHDEKRREKICLKVKNIIKTPSYVNSLIMELDTIFADGLQFAEIPKLIQVSLTLNSHLKHIHIKPSDMKYVIYSMIILYFNNNDEHHDFDTLRKFYNDIFNLVLINPAGIEVSKSILC